MPAPIRALPDGCGNGMYRAIEKTENSARSGAAGSMSHLRLSQEGTALARSATMVKGLEDLERNRSPSTRFPAAATMFSTQICGSCHADRAYATGAPPKATRELAYASNPPMSPWVKTGSSPSEQNISA